MPGGKWADSPPELIVVALDWTCLVEVEEEVHRLGQRAERSRTDEREEWL